MSNSQKKLIQVRQIQVKSENPDLEMQEVIAEEENQLEQIRNEMEELRQRKESIIDETNKQIENEKQNWENEKQKHMELAKQKGYEVGFSQGKEEGLEEFKSLIAQANEIIQSATSDYHATIEKSEDAIVEIAVDVAEKILKKQLHDNPETFLPIVTDAIKSLKDKSLISIYLHPKNYEHVLHQKNELKRIIDSKADLTIQVDDTASEESCVIEHPFGKIDASIDTQLNQIRNVLYEVVMENKQ
ncbi:flagellar assembly protein FliH [Ornithinibacillus salinisoli]|uniref:Flagellar assembly protein FliH n=1 Tax=Ornithinibacillus salinisoli TaxID=1848459 RepID=A0ABW4VZ89_9BACI